MESEVSDKVRAISCSDSEGFSVIPAVIDSESTSPCGTMKLLLKMKDGQQIETVIISMGSDGASKVTHGVTAYCKDTQVSTDVTRPSDKTVTAMWLRIMEEPELWRFRRDTRGEGESAACGMLATKR